MEGMLVLESATQIEPPRERARRGTPKPVATVVGGRGICSQVSLVGL